MSEKHFHLFPKLPTELRLEIWRLCLPNRVWESDFPTDQGFFWTQDPDGSYPCDVTSTAKLNGLPPVLTRVCQESRDVAHESGGVITENFYKDLPAEDYFMTTTSAGIADDFWVDPKRDSVHLNFEPLYEAIYQNSFGPALACLAWESRQVIGRPSFVVDWLSDIHFDREEERFEVFEQITSWWVIMRTVIVHASFRDAARSGLFGLLGDAGVQIVSFSDEERINAFYDFAEVSGRQALSYDGSERPDLDALRQKLKSDLIWAMKSEKLLSRMHPAIMFRLCTWKCNSSSKGTV